MDSHSVVVSSLSVVAVVLVTVGVCEVGGVVVVSVMVGMSEDAVVDAGAPVVTASPIDSHMKRI